MYKEEIPVWGEKKKKYVTRSAGAQGKWKELGAEPCTDKLNSCISNFEMLVLMIYCALNVVLSDTILCRFPQTFILVILNTCWGGRKIN